MAVSLQRVLAISCDMKQEVKDLYNHVCVLQPEGPLGKLTCQYSHDLVAPNTLQPFQLVAQRRKSRAKRKGLRKAP